VVVVSAGTAGRFVLIDGYARVTALRSLRWDTVEATMWEMSETEALIAQFHLQARTSSTVEQAWLLERLSEEGMSQEEIGRRLCRTKSWVSRRMGLLKVVAPEIRAKVACGQIPPQAAMKYLLPLARANAEQAVKLVNALGTQRISVRQMGRLYGAWRAADGVGRERLASSPLLFLQMEAEAERHKVVQPPEVERLIQDLGAAAGICGRASRRVRAAMTGSELHYARRRVLAAWDNARGALVRLGEEIDGRLTEDDRLRDTQGDLHPAQKGAEPAGDRSSSASLPQHGQTGCT
jgi:ParB-like chromosome segregation protein Spo0J